MKVKLTHDLKLKLLEAIREGELDTSKLHIEADELKNMTDEDIVRELARMDLFQDRNALRQKAELMLRLADCEIGSEAYIEEMAKITMLS